jgi:hypothetical protein
MGQKFIKAISLLTFAGASLLSQAQTIDWGLAGPLYTAGRIRNVVVDIGDATGNTLWAGSAAGGVFKSVNGGAQWYPLNDQGKIKNISYMAQDPQSGTIYASTGEGFLRYGQKTKAKKGTGLYKLQNNDLTLVADSSKTGDVINRVAVYNGKIAVAGNKGILVSTDGGTTFNKAVLTGYTYTNNLTYGLDVKFTSTGILYCTVGNERGDIPNNKVKSKVFKSSDASLGNFVDITPVTSADTTATYGRIELAIAPSDENVIYASAAKKNTSTINNSNGSSASLNAIFVSYNGGTTWSTFLRGTFLLDPLTNGGSIASGDYAHVIKVDPSDKNILYVGGYRLYALMRTGGTDATPLVANYALGNYAAINTQLYLHQNIHDVALINGTTRRFYVVTDAGVYRSTDLKIPYTTFPPTFQPYYKGLVTGQFNSVSVDRYPTYSNNNGTYAPSSGFVGGTDGNGVVYYSGTSDVVTTEETYLTGDFYRTEFSRILPDVIFTSGGSNGAFYRGSNIRNSSPALINYYRYTGNLSAPSPEAVGYNMNNLNGTPFALWEHYGQVNTPDSVIFYNDSLRFVASINTNSAISSYTGTSTNSAAVAALTTQSVFVFQINNPYGSAKLDSIIVRTGTVSIPATTSIIPTPYTTADRTDIPMKVTAGSTFSNSSALGTVALTYSGSVANVTVSFSAPPFASRTMTYASIPDPSAYYRVFITSFFRYGIGDTAKVTDERISTKTFTLTQKLTKELNWRYGTAPAYTLAAANNTAITSPTFVLNPGNKSQSTPTFVINTLSQSVYSVSQFGTYTMNAPAVAHTISAVTTTAFSNPTFVLNPGNVTQTTGIFVVTPSVATNYTITATSGTLSASTFSAIGQSTYVLNPGAVTQSLNTFIVSPTISTTYTLLGVSSNTVTGANTQTTLSRAAASSTYLVGSSVKPFSPNNAPVKIAAQRAARLAMYYNDKDLTNSKDAIVVTRSPLSLNEPFSFVRVSQTGCYTDDNNGAPTTNTIDVVGKPTLIEWSKSGTEIYYSTYDATTGTARVYRVSHVTNIYDMTPSSYSGKFFTDVFTYPVSSTTLNPVSPYRTTLLGTFDKPVTSISISNDNSLAVLTFNNPTQTGTTGIVMVSNGDIRKNPTWTNRDDANLKGNVVYSSLMVKSNNKRVMIGTDNGIFMNTDVTSSSAWTNVNNNQLPNVQVFDIKQQEMQYWDAYNSGEIYAATNGRGVWRTGAYFVPYAVGIEEVEKTTPEPGKLNMYPNPSNGNVSVLFTAVDGEKASVQVMDLSGRLVINRELGVLASGDAEASIDVQNLNAGVYIVTIQSNAGQKRTGKLVVTK